MKRQPKHKDNKNTNKATRKPVAIEQLDPKTGEVIAFFSSTREASRKTGVHYRALLRKGLTQNGLRFRKAKNSNKPGKPVATERLWQIPLTMEIVTPPASKPSQEPVNKSSAPISDPNVTESQPAGAKSELEQKRQEERQAEIDRRIGPIFFDPGTDEFTTLEFKGRKLTLLYSAATPITIEQMRAERNEMLNAIKLIVGAEPNPKPPASKPSQEPSNKSSAPISHPGSANDALTALASTLRNLATQIEKLSGAKSI